MALLIITFAVGVPLIIVFGFLYLNNQKEREQERWRVERKIDLLHTGEADGTKQLPGLPFADGSTPSPTANLIPRRERRNRGY